MSRNVGSCSAEDAKTGGENGTPTRLQTRSIWRADTLPLFLGMRRPRSPPRHPWPPTTAFLDLQRGFQPAQE